MVTLQHHIRTVMTTTCRDAKIISLWLDRQRSPHTRNCYRRDAERFLAYVGKPLNHNSLADLQSFAQSLIQLGLAPVSRARTLAAIRSLFAFCHRTRYLTVNPAAELMLPVYENRLAERIVGEENVQRMLAAEPKPRNRILLRLLYAAGLRVSEACHLLWRNLRASGDAGQITVFGKNGRTRAILVPAVVWSELMTARGGASAEELVFRSRSGRPLDRGWICRIVRRAAQRAGIADSVSPHWLRHAHASHALDHGAPIHLVQATLGHSSVATTSRYLHARPGDSSARFLALERISPECCSRIALPVAASGVMNVLTAAIAAQGEPTEMSTKIAESQENTQANGGPVGEPKGPTKAKSGAQKPGVAPAKAKAARKATPAKKAPKTAHAAKQPKTAKPAKSTATRQGSKTAQILDLLKRPGGATREALMKATGWQPHSVRGFLSGTVGKKMGLTVASTKGEGGERTYSIQA